ncbi:unnamed protein product [Schistocephalus solidus]|uniref:Saposin B-type domain-containing protein n=1 Tax=Schistocephalus solidus TaxID=70667 RepID=A0A183T3R5_SCHSO|nr:unnamed protein product [Schistocephalus solidus]
MDIKKSDKSTRAKSLLSLLDVNYEDEACTTCSKLLQNVFEIEKDMKGLIMKVDNSKKLLRFLPEVDELAITETEQDKRIYDHTASSVVTTNEDEDGVFTWLGVTDNE